MRNFLKIAYASAFLLVGLGTAISEPIFLHDGWAAFKRKDDPEQGCIVGKHTNNDVYFLIYNDGKNYFSIGVSSDDLEEEVGQEVVGSVIFDADEPLLIVGKIVEPELVLFDVLDNQINLESLLRESKQIRLLYKNRKLGMSLKGSSQAIDLLKRCSSPHSKGKITASPVLKNQKSITGIVRVGTLDSGIETTSDWYGFMSNSAEGDQIFKQCKMDDRCKITAIIDPKNNFITSVIKVKKVR